MPRPTPLETSFGKVYWYIYFKAQFGSSRPRSFNDLSFQYLAAAYPESSLAR
jgi:hypothetical protein